MSEWVWLISPVNGLPHRVPDNPDVIAAFVARGFTRTDIPGEFNADDEEFAAELTKRQASEEVAELKGKALDEALDDAGLSKSGTVDEKRARLAEHEAAQETSQADAAVEEEEEVSNG